MRIDRFFIDQPIYGDTVTITDERLIRQWQKVLRAKPGFKIVLFDGSGVEYEAEIEEIAPDKAELVVTGSRSCVPITPALWLYVGLVKRDKFEWIIEKATELGAAGITPLLAERSEKKNLSHTRAEKIALEAAEQSGRCWLPNVGQVATVEDALEEVDPERAVVLERAGEQAAQNAFQTSAHLNVFIGPEGGWSKKEQELFEEAGIQAVSLGRQNLKTETAAVSTAALVLIVDEKSRV